MTNRPTDVLGALRAADGLANPRRTSQIGDINDVQVADALPAELLLFSDGGFQDVTEFNLGNLKPTYHAVGATKTSNLAIASFSAQRDLQDPTQVEAFATIVNTGNTSLQAEASLFVDGELFDATTVQLDGEDRVDTNNLASADAQSGTDEQASSDKKASSEEQTATADQAGLSFTIEAVDAVQLRLELSVKDDLALDNQAFAALTPSGLVSVLVITPGNRPVELGLSTAKAKQMAVCEFVSPDFMKTPAYVKRAAAGTDDLIVFDRCQPPKMPATNTFCIGALPNDSWSWTSEPASVTLIDIDRTHPILRYLEMYSLLVFSGRAIEGPKGTANLVESDQGPVMSIGSRDGYQDWCLDLNWLARMTKVKTQANTNWYAERSWPVFLLNVLRHLAGAAQSSGAPSYRPGETVLARLENVVSEVKLVRMDENDQEIALGTLAVGAGGMAEVVQTALLGNYQLVTSKPDRVVDRFAINLFDTQESRLSTREDVEMGYETIAAADAGIETRREYWRWLLVIALAILALEWWLYTRRLA